MIRSVMSKKDGQLDNIDLIDNNEKNFVYTNEKSLLLEQNKFSINDKNESSLIFTFGDFYEKNIVKLFDKTDYITVDNGNNNQESIHKLDHDKIIKALIDKKIIIRDKKFSNFIKLIKTFKSFEDNRLIFVNKIKSLNVQNILNLIDEEYICYYNNKDKEKDKDKNKEKDQDKDKEKDLYKDLYKYKNLNDDIYKDKNKDKIKSVCDISFKKLGIPHLYSYNYLMTFERKNCHLSIEDDQLYLYCTLDGFDYKIIISYDRPLEYFGVSIDIEKKKMLIPLAYEYGPAHIFRDDHCNYLNILSDKFYNLYAFFDKETYKPGLRKKIAELERKYFDKIFRYHNVDIFVELEKKYPNYSFDIFYNYIKDKTTNKESEESYISLCIS